MNNDRRDCFAYRNDGKERYCNCLTNINCKNCSFYKNRNEVKNNIFYPESFKSEEMYKKLLYEYRQKYKEELEKTEEE